MNPLISIIVPTYNCEKTIGRAIESMMNQTYKNLEIIIVDDNSDDNTKEVVKTYKKSDPRITYYALPYDDAERINKHGRNINAGYMARNYGFEKSGGEYITFQDADDASFLNRIEVQYELLKKHGADHVTLDWQKFDEKYLGKKFDVEGFVKNHIEIFKPDDISEMANKSKGLVTKIFGSFSQKIDFEIKRMRLVNKLFFGSLKAYPGTGNSPLFKREIIEKVRFRKLADRIWPSFTGRGADRDFNFQVAETFKNSYVFLIPLYMWRVEEQNPNYIGKDINKYVI